MIAREVTLSGSNISPGFGKGIVFVYRENLSLDDGCGHIGRYQVEEEQQRFEAALDRIISDLTEATKIRDLGREVSAVFQAHCELLRDPALKADVEQQIKGRLLSARTAVRNVFQSWEHRMRGSRFEITRQAAEDIGDLRRRLLRSLVGIETNGLEQLPYGRVLAIPRLLPSDVIALSSRRPAAVLTETATSTSHAALFVRELGIPCVGGLFRLLEVLEDKTYALVDADRGRVVINPARSTRATFRSRRARRAGALLDARARAHEPARTRDGTLVNVLANIACLQDTLNAMENGADGVGLYRTEGVYFGCTRPPDVDELYDKMRTVLAPAKSKPLCVRLLDAGGDKPLPYIRALAEPNPALGSRGIRLLLEQRSLLENQLRALLLLHQELPLSILVPMVAVPLDMERVAELLRELSVELRLSTVPPLGAMVETPAAALCTKAISRHAEFFSVGTNDLTQYALAADRDNSRLFRYFDDTHESIRKLVKIACQDAPELAFSVCGEIAGNVACTSWLLDSGITSLSVIPPLVPQTKESVRRCTVAIESLPSPLVGDTACGASASLPLYPERRDVMKEKNTNGHKKSSAVTMLQEHEIARRAPDMDLLRDAWVQNYLDISSLEEEYEELFQLSPCGCVTVTPEGRIQRVNQAAAALLGAEGADLAGTPFTAQFNQTHRLALAHAMQQADITALPQSLVLLVVPRPGNNAKWIGLDVCAHLYDGGQLRQWQIGITDATHTIARIQALESALATSELRMKELTHRVGNNLMVLSSLVRLKEAAMNGNGQMAELLHQLEAMQGTNELMRISGQQPVNMQSYLENLLKNISTTFDGTPVSIDLSIADIALLADQAVSVGSIVNELAFNAFKHGFADTDQPHIVIRLERTADGSDCSLEIGNSGAPIPDDVVVSSPANLGLQIVACCVDELRGTFELEKAPHPVYRVRFPAREPVR